MRKLLIALILLLLPLSAMAATTAPTPTPTPATSAAGMTMLLKPCSTPTPTPQPCATSARIPLSAIVGNLSTVYGAGAANQRVQYTWGSLQNVTTETGGVIFGGSSCSFFTDAQGNLPECGLNKCCCLPQNAHVWVTFGSAPPVQIQVPLQPNADLGMLIRANTVANWDRTP